MLDIFVDHTSARDDLPTTDAGFPPGLIWVGCADGLENATARMKELAAAKPGKYILWDMRNRKVLAAIDTTEKAAGA